MSGGSRESETSEEIVTPMRLPSWSTVSTATLCGTNRMRLRRSSPSDIGPMIGGDGRGRAVWAQGVGYLAREVLEDREQPRVGDRRAVERVRRVEALAVAAIANTGTTRLVVGRVRARRDLAVTLLEREPRLDVV